MKRTIYLLAGLLSLWGSVAVQAQTDPGLYTWEEFGKRIKASETVSPLGPNFAGDQVSLSNGALSFTAVDVSLPGNNALKVEFSRTYSVFSRKHYRDLGMLADWLVDVPNINAVFAPDWVGGPSNSASRCSSQLVPNVPSGFTLSDFWQGLQISIPGMTNSQLLRTLAGVAMPTDGATYHWVTNDRVHVSCLPSIQNGAGEGFLARTPDGTRYWFNWMGQTEEPDSKYTVYPIEAPWPALGTHYYLTRKRNYLYATRVEDRFGNYVTYTYANAWNEPGKLTQIQGSDGRTLTISYVGSSGTIAAVSDGTRTWTYAYGTARSGRHTLASVKLPDGTAWTIALGPFTNAQIEHDPAAVRNCAGTDAPTNALETFVGKITHPAGATAEFTVDIQEHGNSFVPLSCHNVTGPINRPEDDVNMWPTRSYSLTLKQKKIHGPGQATVAWDYSYQPNHSTYMYPGTTFERPLCDWANFDCSLPPCTSDTCAKYSVTTVSGPNGEWQRHFHGNTYGYNEGKLLRVEVGSGPDSVLRAETRTYDLSRVDQVYPARFGMSLRPNREGFATEYHRPETKVEIVQQGIKFMRNVDAFDNAARPTQVTRSSTTAGGPSDPIPANLPPPALAAPAAANAGAGHTVSWTSVFAAATYVLERKVDGGNFGVVYNAADTSRVLDYPSAATLTYRVKACNVYGSCSAYSNEQAVTMNVPLAQPALTVPSQVVATAGYVAQWNAISGATQYVLERKAGAGAFTVVYTGSGLYASQSYQTAATLWYRVKACNAGGSCSAYSAEGTTRIVRSSGGGGGGDEP